jgi:hypothetical protein
VVVTCRHSASQDEMGRIEQKTKSLLLSVSAQRNVPESVSSQYAMKSIHSSNNSKDIVSSTDLILLLFR